MDLRPEAGAVSRGSLSAPEQQSRRPIAELERYRDDCLLAVLETIKQTKMRHGFDFAE